MSESAPVRLGESGTSLASELLRLQRTAGNRAVSGAVATHLSATGVQRAPAEGDAEHDQASAGANAIVSVVRARIRSAGAFKTVPKAEADLLIGLVSQYLDRYGDANAFLLVGPLSDELYTLLAPWGYKGGGVSEGRLGQVMDDLDAAIGKWKSQSAKERTARRTQTPTTLGTYTAKPSPKDMEIEERQVHQVPMAEGDSYTGPKWAVRAERERRKNARTLGHIGAVRQAGPIATAGMVVGAGTAALTGGDVEFGRDSGLVIGGLGDAPFEALTNAARGHETGSGGGSPDVPAIVERAGPRKAMPTPDRRAARAGDAAVGVPGGGRGTSAGASPPAGRGRESSGMGAAAPAATPDAHITQPGYAPGPAGSPVAPTTQQGYAPGPGGTAHDGSTPAKAAVPDPALAVTAPVPAPAAPGTGAKASGGGAAGGGGGTGFWSRLTVPDGPPPGPVRNVIQPVAAAEVVSAATTRQGRIVPSNKEFHQFRWELLRWQDGRPTKEPAPLAFRGENGFIYVNSDRWREEDRPGWMIAP